MIILYKGIVLFFELLGRLPLKLLYFYGNLFLIMEFIPYNPLKNIINSNLLKIFPNLKNKELKKIRRNIFIRMGNFASEFIKNINDEPPFNLNIKNIETLKESIENNKITICLSGHFCGFEFLTNISKRIKNAKFIMIYEQDIKINYIDNWIKKIRSRGGAILVPSWNCYRFINNLIINEPQEHFVIGALCDLMPTNYNNSIDEVNFFNERKPMYNGLERIGYKLNANFLYVNIQSSMRGHYSIDFRKFKNIDDNIKSLTQEYAYNLAENITQSPYLWVPILLNKL